MKKFETLEFQQNGAMGILTLNREAALNALNQQLLGELEEFLKEADAQEDLHVIILTGRGKAFVAGADIKEMNGMGPDGALEMSRRGQRIFSKLEDSRFITIAAVNGFALGGGLELALSCDILLASTAAKVGLPEVTLGLIPGYGGTQRLARTVGQARAHYMILTGAVYPAAEAFQLGLFARVVEPGELLAEAEKLAATIASRGPVALSLAKRAVHGGLDVGLQEGLTMEAKAFAHCFGTADAREGIRAFIEKRPAQFKGE